MKKIISLCFALLLSVFPILSLARSESILTNCLEKVYTLLFDTENVTVNGQAEFSFDEIRFKTAKLHCIRDGKDSLLDLQLFSPLSNGKEKKTGFHIIGQNGYAYVTDYYLPNELNITRLNPHRSLIRRTVKLDLLMKLALALMPQIEAEIGNTIVFSSLEEGGSELRIRLKGEQIPETLDSCVTLLSQYMGERYRYMNYSNLTLDRNYTLSDFTTVTNALLHCTHQLTVENMDIRVTEDREGRLIGFSGKVDLNTIFSNGESHPLETSFEVSISDYGSSVTQHDNPILEKARRTLKDAGFSEDLSQKGFVKNGIFADGTGFYVFFTNEDKHWEWELFFNAEGRLRLLENDLAPWLTVNGVIDNKVKLYDTPEKRKPLLDRLQEWLSVNNPGLKLNPEQIRVDWEWTYQDALYVKLFDNECGMDFVVQVQPEFRIEYYSAVTNG